MKKKWLGILLSAVLSVSVLAGCGDSDDSGTTTTPPADTGTTTAPADTTPADTTPADTTPADDPEPASGYAGDLTLMHFSTLEESQGNGGSDGFRTMLAEWKAENPDINVIENVLANDEYKTQIAVLAAADDLPDVFLVQGMNVKTWADQGLIMDMTQIIKDSPYYANYKTEFFYPFTYNDNWYGLPALTGGTCTVVVYDKQLWADAGYDTFPANWEDVLEADEYFSGQGLDTIAFGNGGQWQANSCFLSAVGDRFTGGDWTKSLIENTGAAFTDQDFVDALAFTQAAFASGVFNRDFNVVTNEDAREYFIAGDAAAFIGGNWDVSYIQATLMEIDEDKYSNMGFAVFPQPPGATKSTNSQNIGMGYAMALNAKLASDPEKLEAAIDLCYKLTGPDFANFVAKNYALGGLTDVGAVEFGDNIDQITIDFYNWSYNDTNACEIYDSYLTGAVWGVFNTDLQTMLNGDMDPETVAANAQQVYEAE